ncbi:alpha/beta hydrolase [Lacipirellula sp.]|uniref:alpha/beta hydrolase n=1 Tax=Lacipirellula sp. TaxID=2691419 RepID=UPI003D0BD4C9
MKSPHLLIALISNTLVFAFSTLAIAADDYLLKERFESGKKSPTGWREGANIPGVEYIWADSEASHGKRSLGLRKTENRYFPIAQWIRTVPHAGGAANLEVCLKAKAVQAQKAIVDVQFYADGDEMIGNQWLAYLGAKEEGDGPADHHWARYGGVVPVPAGTKKIGLALQIYGPGEVWFDELTARYVPKAGQAAASEATSTATPAAPTRTNATQAPAAEGAITLSVKDDESGEYYFLPAKDKPAGLLVVLPGGDGSAEFHPFVKNIHAHGLGGKYAVAHLVSKRWRPNQQITWPTHRTRTPGMKFTTEEFIAAAVTDAAKRQVVDPQNVYLLGWSSGGPPCYASLLQKESPASGAFVAMSIFRKDDYAAAANAAERSFYIYHSPEDEVCLPRMAHEAKDTLSAAGAKTTLVEYAGGHGWHGDMLGSIREGVEWLEASRSAK